MKKIAVALVLALLFAACGQAASSALDDGMIPSSAQAVVELAAPSSAGSESGQSFYRDFWSRSTEKSYEITGIIHQNQQARGLVRIEAAPGAVVPISGKLSRVRGDLALVYSEPGSAPVIVAEVRDGGQESVSFETEVSVTSGNGELYFTGTNAVCRFELSLSLSPQAGYYLTSENPPNGLGSTVYEAVELLHDEASGWPYLHDIYSNRTGKDIVGRQYCMLAYDKDGQPLKLRWNILDSSSTASYEWLQVSDQAIAAGETMDQPGGWSLYDEDKMPEFPKVGEGGPNRVAFALYCDKEITFSDGSVWHNPAFDDWLAAYRGKAVPVEKLKSYYPHVQYIGSASGVVH